AGLTHQPHCEACEQVLRPVPNHPVPRHRASSPPRDGAVRSTPHGISVPIPTVPIVAGSGWAISVPTVIQTAVPGDSCGAAAGGGTFWRLMAPSFMARV